MFIEPVKTICWRNKIAESTLNLAAGTEVTEIEVFEIKLGQPDLDEAFFRQVQMNTELKRLRKVLEEL